MIYNFPNNAAKAVLLATFERWTLVYIKQYGAGNLRIGSDANRLEATIGAATQDGISQATAQGFVMYWWIGDLYAISDAAGPIVWDAPGYEYVIQRAPRGALQPNEAVSVQSPGELEGDLSTY